MVNDQVKYLFVKRKTSDSVIVTLDTVPKKPFQNKTTSIFNRNVEHNLYNNETRSKRDSQIVNTKVDHDYDMLVKTLSLVVKTMKINRNTRRKYKVYRYCKKEVLNVLNYLNHKSHTKGGSDVIKPHSTPIVRPDEIYIDNYPKRSKSYNEARNKIQFNTNFIVNSCCKTCNVPECINPFINPMVQARVYECQLKSLEEKCCCSCNSDAMFEVMKSLYDCYKKRNCENCNCILCGHLPCVDPMLAEGRKTGVDIGVTSTDRKKREEKLEHARAEGLLTPLEGKTSTQKEKIVKGLVKAGLPLPEGKTTSEKKIIQKVRLEMGLPPEPQSDKMKEKYARALAQGIITPLEGKTPAQKENVLKRMAMFGIPMPEGRTQSEKALIDKIKANVESRKASKSSTVKRPSEKFRIAQNKGLLTPLDGKSPKEIERIVNELAKLGLPLPVGKTAAEKKLIEKIRTDMGLPPEGKTLSQKKRLAEAYAAGIITPLKGKSADQKIKYLKMLADAGVVLPKGRTSSEKALIDKIRDETSKNPVDKLQKAKMQGLLTPLEGKLPEQKENILKGLAKLGLPLPEGKTPSEKSLLIKVRRDMGYPAEPRSPSEKEKLGKAHAAGIITPLEGKSLAQKEAILRKMVEAGVLLPEGKSPSEKAFIAKIKKSEQEKSNKHTEKLKQARAAGFLTSLDGKSPEQREKILRGLAKAGLPLPEGNTPSQRKLIQKIKMEMGLPIGPKTSSEKQRIDNAYAAGLVTPLEGKTLAQKETILRKLVNAGVTLPKGRTPSEKELRTKLIKKKAEADGLFTPLEGKSVAQKEKILRGLVKAGLPLPEGKTSSEKKLIQSIKYNMGLPPGGQTSLERQKISKAYAAGIITPLEGKTPAEKENILKRLAEAGVTLPEGRSPSEKDIIIKIRGSVPTSSINIPSEKLRKAKKEGLLTPLEGKSPSQIEKILRGLAKAGFPLPDGKTESKRKLIQKVRYDMGLPAQPKISTEKKRLAKAYAAGIVSPLEGKTPPQKENLLRKLAKAGVLLPEGRTPSEKTLIKRIQADSKRLPDTLSEINKKAKTQGLLTSLKGKPPEQQEKILRGLANLGLPLPEGKTPSEKRLIKKVRHEMGYPVDPQTPSQKQNLAKAHAAGIVAPLVGKTTSEKKVILQKLIDANVSLPDGRTDSEKLLISKLKASAPSTPAIKQSEKMEKAKELGLLVPLEGKSVKEKEKVLRELAKLGLPLPEGKTPSEEKLIEKVRYDMGLPAEPKISTEKETLAKAYADGIVSPLEGKTPSQKENLLRKFAKAGVPLPEGRTPSEITLIKRIQADSKGLPDTLSEINKKAKTQGLLTSLKGKPPEQQEKILRGLANLGLPLPEGKTPSEKRLIKRVRHEMGYPVDPQTPSQKQNLAKAHAAGIVAPLVGKTNSEKKLILQKLIDANVSLPDGRTNSEKALIAKLKASASSTPATKQSEKMKKAKALGLLTPLEGKSVNEKEKLLRDLAKLGLPLPEGKTPSDEKLIQKVRNEVGYPSQPRTSFEKQMLAKAHAEGIVSQLEGKKTAEKETILSEMAKMGVPLPEGRSPSEKALISRIKDENLRKIPVENQQKVRAEAKAAGLLTPLDGKSPAQKEKILRGLAKAGLPLPEGKTQSEKKLIKRIKKELGLPPEATAPSEKHAISKSHGSGICIPLDGKTPAEKESILKKMADAGIPLPEGRTVSEKEFIRKLTAVNKCERGCGCDKKKIRFKHSYIKIRVTSPDISSFCLCPDECLPGVKGGVFMENGGIKVVVGLATGVPVFNQSYNKRSYECLNTFSKKLPASLTENTYNKTADAMNNYQRAEFIVLSDKLKETDSSESVSSKYIGQHVYQRYTSASLVHINSNYIVNNTVVIKNQLTEPCFDILSNHSMSDFVDFSSSVGSVVLLNSDSSIDFSARYSIADNVSASDVSVVVLTSNLSLKPSTNQCDIDIKRECEYLTKEIDYSPFLPIASDTVIIDSLNTPSSNCTSKTDLEYNTVNDDIIILRLSDKKCKVGFVNRNKIETEISDKNIEDAKVNEPIVVIGDNNTCPMTPDVMKKITELLAAKPLNDESSVFIVVPSDDICNDYEHNLSSHNTHFVKSTVALQISDDRPRIDDDDDPSLKPLCEVYNRTHPKLVRSGGIKFSTKPKGIKSKNTFLKKALDKDYPCQYSSSEKELKLKKSKDLKDYSVVLDIHASNEIQKKSSPPQVNTRNPNINPHEKSTTKLHIDKMTPKVLKAQVMFDDQGFETLSAPNPVNDKEVPKARVMFDDQCFETFSAPNPVNDKDVPKVPKRRRRVVGVDTTADRPCCCQPCNFNTIDEKQRDSTLPIPCISHHGLVSRGGSSPAIRNRIKTTDEGLQTSESPDPSNSHLKVPILQPLLDQPCCCEPKNKFSDSQFRLFYFNNKPENSRVLQNQTRYNESTVCNSKYDFTKEYVKPSYVNNEEYTSYDDQEQHSEYTDGTDYHSCNKQSDVIKISLLNPNKLCQPTCKINDIVPNSAKGESCHEKIIGTEKIKMQDACDTTNPLNQNTISSPSKDKHYFVGQSKIPEINCEGSCVAKPSSVKKNHNVLYPPTNKNNGGPNQGNNNVVKCDQSVCSSDSNKDETHELQVTSRKHPSSICVPTYSNRGSGNSNMKSQNKGIKVAKYSKDVSNPANHEEKMQQKQHTFVKKSKASNDCPPTCSHVQNANALCDKDYSESEVATNNIPPLKFCTPTCSRAERLGSEELQAGARQPDNVPFMLLPENTASDQPNKVQICAPRCGQPPLLEMLGCEQTKLMMRNKLRETMGDDWSEPERGTAFIIDERNINEQIECICHKKPKKGKYCKCHTQPNIKRKKKCLCRDYIHPEPPKIAPDLPQLPPPPKRPILLEPLEVSSQTVESGLEAKQSSSGSINLRDQIMLQTEQTQAMSGFKMSNRSTNVTKDYSYKEGDLFYDDAIIYFDGDIPPEIEALFEVGPWERPPGYLFGNDAESKDEVEASEAGQSGNAQWTPPFYHQECSCEDRETHLKETMCPEEYEKLYKRHKCECPPKTEVPPEIPPELVSAIREVTFATGDKVYESGLEMEPAKINNNNGLKFAIGGKGTGSQGLNGICCFDFSIQEDATLTDDLSDNDLIIYTD